jgi:hypothetical protein
MSGRRRLRGRAIIPAALAVSWLMAVQTSRAQWTLQTIETGPEIGWHVNLNADYRDRLYAAYYRAPGGTGFASDTGAGWQVQPPVGGYGFRLTTDRRGRQVLARASRDLIELAERNAAGEWSNLTVASGGTFSTSVSVVHDALNRPHVSYIDIAQRRLVYARWTGSAWDRRTVATGGAFGLGNSTASLAISPTGEAYFAYHDFAARALKFLRPQSAGWTASTIDDNAFGRAFAFDAHGVLHVAYTESSKKIYHATWDGAAGGDGAWNARVVDDDARGEPAMTFDASGGVHLSYPLRHGVGPPLPDDGLRHAHRDGSAWVRETVTNWPNVREGLEISSVRVDRRGGVHIAFVDDVFALRYATKPGAGGGAERRLAPAFDVQATALTPGGAFVIAEGGDRLLQSRPSTGNPGSEHRGVLEFDVAAIPDGATVYTAVLRLEILAAAAGPERPASIDVFGYAGDGVASADDATRVTQLIGSSGALAGPGVVDLPLDPAYVQSLVGSASGFLGIVASAEWTDLDSSFGTTERFAQGMGVNPTLILTYTPEPCAALALAQMALFGLARRARRRSLCR